VRIFEVVHQLTDLPGNAADIAAFGDRYGQLYGPGTCYPSAPPGPPRIHVDDAARQSLPPLTAPRA